MGYNQLLISERRGDEQGMLYLKNIDELTQRSIELVRQLLLFSRRTDSQIKVININTEIKSMHNLLNKSIPKMIDIKTNLADNVFPIDAESVQIGQIIMNLVINARDAIGDSGNILITTRNLILEKNTTIANVTLSGGKYIELSVSDTGCGIEKNIIQLIFEPFFTTKEAGKGTGLGLSVVYGIVKSHNGFISCESEPNKGTTFHIFLPASLTSLPQRVADTHPKQLPTGNETILFVDDEKSILETGKDTLTIYGYKVLMASDGEQALELYKSSKDDIRLVILDLIMPGRGGKKCLSELLAFNPSAKVLMTSGYTAYRQETDLLEYGASGFIGKPYRPEDLLASIRRILDSDGQSV
jgi:CheY-like chemotaxis protein